MKKYTYSPPKIKASTKLVEVLNQNGEVTCSFNRKYNNFLLRVIDSFLEFNFFVHYDVFKKDGQLSYQGRKIPRWGKTKYELNDVKRNEKYIVTYKSWQVVLPEFLVTSNSREFVVKKDMMDWAKVYFDGREVARWKMKTSEWFKTYLEIEEGCPIQEPEFFVCLFQCILYIGD